MFSTNGMVLFDCEIKNIIEPNKDKRHSYLKYANGWNDYLGMGISCICSYDYRSDEYAVFLDDNFSDFEFLCGSAQYICGFNNNAFDNKLCISNGITLNETKSVDVLQLIWKAAGLGPVFERRTHTGYSLDNCIKVNFGDSLCKRFEGSNAPLYWQTGNFGKVISYCLHDVKMLKLLVDKIALDGYIISPKSNSKLKLV